ncbi:MAG: DUF134 domain-containing protein [Candidatus Omnitrophica bacterium]|nr:DUF134 domain-containing protein [Candidatus Omnitrophota bacterium]
MRPKKIRQIKYLPNEKCFKPLCKPLSKLENVYLTLDEFEAIRLSFIEGLKQLDAAKKLKISRPTFSRILTSAQKKIADGMVNIKAIRIEGGCCQIIKKKE